MWFRDHLSQVGGCRELQEESGQKDKRKARGGRESRRPPTLTPARSLIFLCDGKAPGYGPLITSDEDNWAPVVSRTDCYTKTTLARKGVEIR